MEFEGLDLQAPASSNIGPMLFECVLLLTERGQARGGKVVSGEDFVQGERCGLCLLESRDHKLRLADGSLIYHYIDYGSIHQDRSRI